MAISSTAVHVPVRRLWIAVLCGYLALGATLQALPTFVPLRFGGGALASGTAVGVAFLAIALVRPFAGRFADAGRARPVVMLGGVLGALGGLGHLWAPNFTVLIVARLLMGAGEAALFSGALPWVLATAPATRRGRVAGWFGLSMWGGLAAGPLLATALAASGFTAVWTAVVVLGLVAAALVFTTRGRPAPISEISLVPRRWSDIVPPGASSPGLAFGLSSYGYGTVAALLVLHLRTDAIGTDSYALAVFAAAFLLNRAASSPAVDRFGGRAVAAVSVLTEAIGLTLIATTHTLALFGVVLAGAGVALMYPATVAITLDRTGVLRPGTSVGVMTSFWDVGIMVAGPLGGAIAAGFSYPLAFLLAAASSLFSLVVITTVLHSHAHREASAEPAGQPARPASSPSMGR
ncbi:MAG TPA: MFS transporter [Pseudonocardiaceae bacterium]|jgi:MFS family permease